MENQEFLNDDVVLSVNPEDNIVIGHHTYQVKEFLQELGRRIDKHRGDKWIVDGVVKYYLPVKTGVKEK